MLRPEKIERDPAALREDGSCRELTYSQLATRANRFANVLRGLGVGDGARIFVLAGRRAELYEAVLGALKTRLQIGSAEILVTTTALYRRKIAPLRAELPTLKRTTR